MRLERISPFVIKAYLTADDLRELEIKDASFLDRKAADLILDVARSELGFNCEKANCEIFTESFKDGYTLTIKVKSFDKKSDLHKSVLCFDDSEALFTACEYLLNFDISESELRTEGDGRAKTYYLIVEYKDSGAMLDGKPYWLLSVSELCSYVQTDKTSFFYYIFEHCTPAIEKNAVFDIAKSEKKW